MNRSFNLSEWAVTHPAMVLFLIIATLVSGLWAFTHLGQSEDPQFNVPSMTVVVAWPGATTREVHDHVINPIEQALQDIGGVDNIRSFSRQGYGGLTMWMKGRQSKAELEAIWYQARKKVGDIRHQLPPDIRGPFFNDEYTDVYTTLYAVQSPDLGMAELQEVAEQIKRRLQTVPDVAKVALFGAQDEKLFIEVSQKRLAQLGRCQRVQVAPEQVHRECIQIAA